MGTILEEIAQKTKERVKAQKRTIPFEEMKQKAEQSVQKDLGSFPFYQAFAGKRGALICEVKKASPSKGIIAEHFPYMEIAKDYENGGASALSILTEPYYFLGDNRYLTEIREQTSLPILRKDFIVDAYQIYETKTLGASACLLICAILGEEQLKEYLSLAHTLGLSALVETHNEEEIAMALRTDAKIIGVNNRDLKDFSVNVKNSGRLRGLVPEDVVFIAESGIKNISQVQELKKAGVNGLLIGETFMLAPNRVKAVHAFANA